MIPELGHFALILALLVAIAQGVLPLVGRAPSRRRADGARASGGASRSSRWWRWRSAALRTSFATSDFSVENVAQHSNSQLPLPYRLAATWGSHEGSLLLWMLMLTGWALRGGAALAAACRRRCVARVLAVMGLVGVGFLLFMLFTSNPFLRLVPAAPDGRDLNPLLQDPGMVIHPPMLYMGYVGFSVAFAFAIAALLGGRLDATWARWSRPWTIAAWSFLTIGIALGSWWAYYELGWGGWWFWDPVENASFMPWLVGTALVAFARRHREARHASRAGPCCSRSSPSRCRCSARSSCARACSRRCMRSPPIRRAACSSSASSSSSSAARCALRVRAPARSAAAPRSRRCRASRCCSPTTSCSWSRARACCSARCIRCSLDALNLGKISVGPPYFDAVFCPLMAPLAFLMGIGPIASWRKAALPDLWTRLKWALGVAVVAALAAAAGCMGGWSPLVAARPVPRAVDRRGDRDAGRRSACAHAPQRGLVRQAARRTPPRGTACCSRTWASPSSSSASRWSRATAPSRTSRSTTGRVSSVGGYDFTFRGVVPVDGPNYTALAGIVEMRRDGMLLETLHPEKRIYNASGTPMTEAAIDAGHLR